MATAAQITANQANALHSTGPRTHEGKARVAGNALRHGLTAKHLVVPEDQREYFETLRADLAAELSPQGAVETLTFNELLHAAWNLHRFRLLEAQHPDDDPAFLDRLSRYQARAQRAYYRALGELRTLQTNRVIRAVQFPKLKPSLLPVTVDIRQVTKQSHFDLTSRALDMAIKMVRCPEPFETRPARAA